MKKYYGIQTEAAIQNFPFSIPTTSIELIYSITQIKKAAAIAHWKSKELDPRIAKAISQACDEVMVGEFDDQFITPALQGGAGTSINMNVNEVIANRSTEILKGKRIDILVHPNDHVNMGQSTNDVNPSALRITCIKLVDQLLKSLNILILNLRKKTIEFSQISKLGRTHLQDAVPIRLGDEFQAYANIMENNRLKIVAAKKFMLSLNLSGTAVGNSINASSQYQKQVYLELNKITKLHLKPAKNLMAQTSSQTDFLTLSQAIVGLTVDASKIASDLRLMSSGPKGGLEEIILRKLQAGSSIMPGKANPILAESVNQLYFLVSGNNLTIEQAAQMSQLELGVMLPILADRLILSLKLTTEVLANFATECVAYIEANKQRCQELLENSMAYSTLLTPVLGYDVISEVVDIAIKSNQTLRQVILDKKLMTESQFEEVISNSGYSLHLPENNDLL